MKIFLDTADTEKIRYWCDRELMDGITTNPSIIANSGRKYGDVLREICSITSTPVSAEVVSEEEDEMINQALQFTKIAENIVVKVPVTKVGLSVCRKLRNMQIKVNVTLCFSVNQAILAAKAGANYISPFVGRLDDISGSGVSLVSDIITIYENYSFDTEVIAASIRNPKHVSEMAEIGCHIVTLSPNTLDSMFNHPMTDVGLEIFNNDWKRFGKSLF